MTTVIKPGDKVSREIPVEALDIPGAQRDLIVTLDRIGITFRGKGRRTNHTITWGSLSRLLGWGFQRELH